jgi:hypothetical protein
VFSERDARRVLMDGVGGVAKGDDRHGQCENGLEVEPALHVLGRSAGRDGFGNSARERSPPIRQASIADGPSSLGVVASGRPVMASWR